MQMHDSLEKEPVEASAPCRIDMGGTLDLSTFHLPLRHLKPCTFNIALDLRTQVRLTPFDKGRLKISSHGFDSVIADRGAASFNTPLGLMFAVAAYFQADGVHVQIHSSSPPRSALGGSSVAAVALIWAFAKVLARGDQSMPKPSAVALLAHEIEQSVAGVPCGLQDQLAAVYGGVHAWYWKGVPGEMPFERQSVVTDSEQLHTLGRSILVAYCGRPHVSKDVNASWVRQFVDGQHREIWHQIAACGRRFVQAVSSGDYQDGVAAMNQETDLRCHLTPDVLDGIGHELVDAARQCACGARFTGAGGGGCIWALGTPKNIETLRPLWDAILARRERAGILRAMIDTQGLL